MQLIFKFFSRKSRAKKRKTTFSSKKEAIFSIFRVFEGFQKKDPFFYPFFGEKCARGWMPTVLKNTLDFRVINPKKNKKKFDAPEVKKLKSFVKKIHFLIKSSFFD